MAPTVSCQVAIRKAVVQEDEDSARERLAIYSLIVWLGGLGRLARDA